MTNEAIGGTRMRERQSSHGDSVSVVLLAVERNVVSFIDRRSGNPPFGDERGHPFRRQGWMWSRRKLLVQLHPFAFSPI
jgi:hypothetical protein